MKRSRTLACFLLSSALLNLTACEQVESFFGVGRKKPAIVPKPAATITACKASGDQLVYPGLPVVWVGLDDTYAIKFKTKTDPYSNPPNLDITPAPPITPFPAHPKVLSWDTTNTPIDCRETTATTPIQGCYFKYSIYYVRNGVPEQNPCSPDPGVHVIPTGTGVLSASNQ